MPTWLAIVLGVFVALVIILAIGGAYARRRQFAAGRERFDVHLAQVNRDLAAAHASDRGWAREGLEAAARAAYVEQRDGSEPEVLQLVQIVDRPGTDDDKAVFSIASGGRDERLTLGRKEGDWVFESLV
jgi:2-hydroxychromene-2-carboxylate isomerase